MTAFPFVACAGTPDAKLALLLAATDPRIGGVLLTGGPGNGKGLLVDAFRSFVLDALGQELIDLPATAPREAWSERIDIGASLDRGRVVRRSALTARGSAFLVEHADLLEPFALVALRAAADRGASLIATTESRAGHRPVPDWLMVRVDMAARRDPTAIELMLERRIEHERDPLAFVARWRDRQAELADRVRRAKAAAARIPLDTGVIARMCTLASELAVPGARAPIAAVRAARAHAAFAAATSIGDRDLAWAERFVLQPRAGRRNAAAREPGPAEQTRSEHGAAAEGRPGEVVDQVFDAAADAPHVRGPAAGCATAASGTRAGSATARSIERGKPLRVLKARGRRGRIAIAATIRAAAMRELARGRRVQLPLCVRPDDLRIREFREPRGTLFVLVVDSSGSMARNRMREAKGSATRILRDAYQNRDALAVIAMRGVDATVLVRPTRSVREARRALELLPTSGGTPLASALAVVAHLAAAHTHGRPVQCLFFTDGRANVPLAGSRRTPRDEVARELLSVAARFRRLELPSRVVDTRPAWDRRTDARDFATWIGADYIRL